MGLKYVIPMKWVSLNYLNVEKYGSSVLTMVINKTINDDFIHPQC